MERSQIMIEEFSSQALVGNPLGDPVTRRTPVYLPPGYDENEDYPSIYLLTAFAARGLKFLNDSLWEENIPQRLDRLIGEGAIQPAIVVMPDSSTRYGGSQFMNSSATGKYEDSLLELVSFIDGKYPTKKEPTQRAVMGHSSGGYGALRLGMRHPETFGVAAAHAPDLYFEMVYQKDFPHFLRFYEKAGKDGLAELLADPGAALAKGVSFYALATCAMAACYSPNPEALHGFDLPFNTYSGELDEAVWARWRENDPLNMVDDHQDALRKLKMLFMDCGLYDEENLLYGARQLAQKMYELKIPMVYEEFEGGHRHTQHRYDVSLKLISRLFDGG